jgi:uncharacterized DUF497 family protein
VNVEFDPAKDAANIAKHGVSLARAGELEIVAVVEDGRFSELRYRIYGTLDGMPHCLAATLRAGTVRGISFRRSHLKEYRRHVR